MNTQEVLKQIELLQDIQRTHTCTSKAWITASELLKPLFEHMREVSSHV